MTGKRAILVYVKSKILHWLILAVFTGLFVFSRTPAKERNTNPLLQYIHKIYTSEEGLPQNRARAIVQTYDGYLWIGTQDGLARFNGTILHVSL